jgi:hypothetical protein
VTPVTRREGSWPRSGCARHLLQERRGLLARRPRFSGPISEQTSQDASYSPSSHLSRIVLHRRAHGCPGAEGCYENRNTPKELEEPAVHGCEDTPPHTVGEPDRVA